MQLQLLRAHAYCLSHDFANPQPRRRPDAGARACGGSSSCLCGALFLDALDVSMVGVALPSIRTDLGLSTASLQWVVSGYVLGYGGLLLLGGRAADLLGRRRVFLAALAVFAVASLLGGLVSTRPAAHRRPPDQGRGGRVHGAGRAVDHHHHVRRGAARNRALSIYSAFGAGGFSLGLVLSGLLTEVSWRLTLLLPAPVAALVLVAAIRLIPRGESPAGPRPAVRPAGRGHGDGRDAAARLRGGQRAAVRLGVGPDAGSASRAPPPSWPRSSPSSGAAADPLLRAGHLPLAPR